MVAATAAVVAAVVATVAAAVAAVATVASAKEAIHAVLPPHFDDIVPETVNADIGRGWYASRVSVRRRNIGVRVNPAQYKPFTILYK